MWRAQPIACVKRVLSATGHCCGGGFSDGGLALWLYDAQPSIVFALLYALVW